MEFTINHVMAIIVILAAIFMRPIVKFNNWTYRVVGFNKLADFLDRTINVWVWMNRAICVFVAFVFIIADSPQSLTD